MGLVISRFLQRPRLQGQEGRQQNLAQGVTKHLWGLLWDDVL